MNTKLSSKFKKLSKGKKGISATILVAGIMGMLTIPENVYAHGFVEKPSSRAALCSQKYDALNLNCGNVMYEPQSLEAPKGFPQGGPIDGKIASAGGLFGGILDQQTVDRWFKNTITGGPNTFTWKYTAPHATSKWHYYITKKGWNPNKPLTRADFEPIGTVEHNGSAASNNISHTINVPTDRNGYHVILAVWDVADTSNAFYNVIDVNLINNDNSDKQPPTKPQGLHVLKVTPHSIGLKWDAASDNIGVKEYQVFRNGKSIGSVFGTTFTDTKLQTNTEYVYTIKAIDVAGNMSEESQPITVKTMEEVPDTEAPTQPTTLHAMEVTNSSVNLMWSASEDNVEVDHYVIYREVAGGKPIKIGTTNTTSFIDKNLQANTTYTYTVTAIDTAENESMESNKLTVTTKEQSSSFAKWDPYKAYTKGDKVEYQGKLYEAVQSYQGNGDPNWIFALSLWKPLETK
ncbi:MULTISPECIES: lytic polysaccharide monooxygenase [Bacillus cereus group]|uniref:Chitin-binding domain 3 protein n=1 Tax=Bacillus cytotoxicus (strain DSM 22905 / CIP 110041 / 391-98 / NVH 391-98) TaxID=315749 RepID=A7GQQ4_BACCN|nr:MULTISPECIES: lytic polysaccharide monooxygenase [Bacillus cereus group]ABS22462.1 chitin-binding domain 3 protein [Bacillus cytotoxicus NVH 391-98]AWC29055.1 chitin-binding protein [Bacillus cytotoxicus]AWC39559.1 chitin-binding protein [Bacillus cytotoxicus]AWC45115.1 chitin-binding protein [Bacillus cytotoxicus]AWC47490.1 chitin-binding protein [Bacillus cytotoxicus]